MLKLEEATVAAVGFRHSIRPFRDSITCLLFAREPLEPCDHFVPRCYKETGLPCHQISLNQAGDTVAAPEAGGKHDRLKEEVLVRLRNNIARLEQERSVPG